MTVQIALRLDEDLAAAVRAAADAGGMSLSEWLRRVIRAEADRAAYQRAYAAEQDRPLYTAAQEDAIMAARARRQAAWQNGEVE
jgi:hypothetical protein